MSGDYYRLLLKRSKGFLALSERLLTEKEYDLAVFHAEQAVQLRIKALLYKLWGLTPRSHSIRWLMGVLRENLSKAGLAQLAERVDEFVRENRALLAALEDAYTLTRYGHLEYDSVIASELVSIARKLYELLEEVEEVAVNVGETGD